MAGQITELQQERPYGRQLSRGLPAEGEGGLFTQSWFPVCLSQEAQAGKIAGVDFLDGRVVVVRDASGEARVMSAYCPHLGADLSRGEMVDGRLRCAFHHWRYDTGGQCVMTAVGDAPPADARLFAFPTLEKFGLVWAFNGVEPLYDLPDFPYPEDELELRTVVVPELMDVDPWVLCCNTPDMQHIKALHGVQFDQADPHADVEWTDSSMLYNFKGFHKQGEVIDNRVGIFGTSLYYQSTVFQGRWFGFLTPFGMPAPGRSKIYMVVAARKDSGTPEDVSAFLDFVVDLERSIVAEDEMIMRTVRFRPGILTGSDRTLARFFLYLREYPRAHPSADFIR